MLPTLNPAAEVPTQDRAIPSCPHFGPCGGCQLQHLSYPTQLAFKAAQLRAGLEAANLTLPELQVHPSPPHAYRNRIRLTLAEYDGQLRAGYLCNPAAVSTSHQTEARCGCPTSGFSDVGSAGNEDLDAIPTSRIPTFLPITECPIAAPILWRTTQALLAHLNRDATRWLRNPNQVPDQLELFTTADESRLQLTLYLRTAAKSLPKKLAVNFTAFCESLRVRIPELSGAGLALLPLPSKQRSRRNEQPRPGPTWGTPGLNYRVDKEDSTIGAKDEIVIPTLSGTKGNPRISPLPLPVPQPATDNLQPATYWVPRNAFFQVNRFLLPNLLALVAADRSGDLAFDLYAGVGLFSRALAAHFAQVTAVEIAEPAATALASTKLTNLRAIKATTLDFLRLAVTERDRPDLIVLDPPRNGAGPEVCALLARIAAPTLIYVSCSPETLPADLTTLAASGYRIAELHLFDLFPQTTHIESVAILTR